MKPKNPFIILVGCLALALTPCHFASAADTTSAARQASGSISGRVQNAVSGNYLNNARVTVRGTDRTVFTDESGTYLINDAPAGEAIIEVFYTGLDPQLITLSVPAGQRVTRDIQLGAANANVVKLDSFVVASSRETDAMAIAN